MLVVCSPEQRVSRLCALAWRAGAMLGASVLLATVGVFGLFAIDYSFPTLLGIDGFGVLVLATWIVGASLLLGSYAGWTLARRKPRLWSACRWFLPILIAPPAYVFLEFSQGDWKYAWKLVQDGGISAFIILVPLGAGLGLLLCSMILFFELTPAVASE